MEKYKRWTDHATGINPFVPFQRKNTRARYSRTLHTLLIAPLLFLVKSPLLIVVMTATIIYNALLDVLVPVSVVKRPIARYLNFLFARFTLLLLGFWSIDVEQVLSSGRRIIAPTGHMVRQWVSGLDHGDLVMANHVSYIEVLYLAMRFSPTFAAVVWDDQQQQRPKVVPQTFVQFLLSTMLQVSAPVEKAQDLKDLLLCAKQQRTGPVVLFPEGTTSNGSALLAFQDGLFAPDFGTFIKDHGIKVHLFAFKFEFQNFSPAHHVPGIFGHIYGMLTQMYNTIHVKFVENVLEDGKREFNITEQRNTIAKCLRQRQLSRDLNDKRAFLDYWNETQQRKYVEKTSQ